MMTKERALQVAEVCDQRIFGVSKASEAEKEPY